jgi:hypothetical protein
MPEPKTKHFMLLLVQLIEGTAQNKEGHLLVALCFYLLTYLRLLAARAVGAAAAGGVASGGRIAAAVTVVVGHVFDPFYVWEW